MPWEPWVASPSGAIRDQAARINGPERDTRSNGRVDGGVQLRLVINAIEAEAAGEVDERFLLVQLAQHFGGGLQGGELAIGVEDVELAVVLSKCGARVGAAGIVDGLGGSLAFANDESFKDAEQLVAIGGEVLQDVDRTTLVAQDGYQVDSGQLRANELLCCRERAQLVGRAHRSHVEVKCKQPAILIAIVLHRFRLNLRARELLINLDIFTARRGGSHRRRVGGQRLVFAEADSLGDAIFGKRKVLGREPRDEFSLLILDHDGFHHQLRFD